MAIGARIFGGVISTNAVATVQVPTVTVTGGVTVAWADLATEIDVLISQCGGDRSPQAGGDFQTDTHTVSGTACELGRTEIRLKITDCPDLPDLVEPDVYLRVNSAVPHPGGRGGRLKPRTTLRCSRIQLPGNQLA